MGAEIDLFGLSAPFFVDIIRKFISYSMVAATASVSGVQYKNFNLILILF